MTRTGRSRRRCRSFNLSAFTLKEARVIVMNRDKVARIWTFRALSDLYFGFDVEYVPFEANARFSEIMGLEKFLKAFLLYHRHEDYELLTDQEAREKLQKLAMKQGHKFDSMLQAVSDLGVDDISRILRTDYDGYLGADLVDAVKAGYMETRYPIPKPIADSFPLEGGFTHDPLNSSGITKFIYAVCNACYCSLERNVDFSMVCRQFQEEFEHRESYSRFNNLFWESRCKARPK